MHKFAVKPEIYYAEGALEGIYRPGVRRVMLIVDPVMRAGGFCERVEAVYARSGDVQFAYYTNIKPDPGIELIVEGVHAALDFCPDLIVALGGGSAIDEAKTIVMLYHKIRLAEDAHAVKPLFAAIPTTSGTGSEVTNVSVITVDGAKVVLSDETFLPDMAILDVAFTKTLPLPILAETAVDALTHALEAYMSRNGSDCTDAFAEKAIQLIFKYLAEIFEKGDSLEARSRLHNASCIAGMAFTNASLGINHSMAHALGALFHVSHGKSNAVFLSKTLAFNARLTYVADKLTALCRELNFSDGTPQACVEALIREIERLLARCGLPAHIKELGIPLDDYLGNIFELTERAAADRCTPTNPAPVDRNDFFRLFIQAYEA